MTRYETLSQFKKRQHWQCECGKIFAYQSEQHKHAEMMRHSKVLRCNSQNKDGMQCQMPAGHIGDHGCTIFGNKVRIWK